MKGPPSEFIAAIARQAGSPPGVPGGRFRHWERNVFEGGMPERFLRMFRAGSGDELSGKACAKHSSSMLAYNFFHWVSKETPMRLFGKTFVDVAFEVRLPCMSPQAPANLDVALLEDGGRFVLFLESKFTEFFNFESSEFRISRAYENPKNYPWAGGSGLRAENWAGLVSDLVETYGSAKDRYHGGIKQALCHLIAIDRLRNSGRERRELAKSFIGTASTECKYAFATVVFEPADRFKAEHGAFLDYRNLFASFAGRSRFSGTEFFWPTGGFLTYGDIWESSVASMPDRLRPWLEKRYMSLAATRQQGYARAEESRGARRFDESATPPPAPVRRP